MRCQCGFILLQVCSLWTEEVVMRHWHVSHHATQRIHFPILKDFECGSFCAHSPCLSVHDAGFVQLGHPAGRPRWRPVFHEGSHPAPHPCRISCAFLSSFASFLQPYPASSFLICPCTSSCRGAHPRPLVGHSFLQRSHVCRCRGKSFGLGTFALTSTLHGLSSVDHPNAFPALPRISL